MKTQINIAIPFFVNRISNRLDASEHFLIIKVDNGMIKERKKVRLVHNNLLALIDFLNQFDVHILICGGITRFYLKQLNNTKISVIPWIYGNVDQVLIQFLEGKLNNQT